MLSKSNEEMKMNQDVLYAVSVVRVSTTKQDVFGDSLDDQVNQIELARQRLSAQMNCEIQIKKTFEFAESASVDFNYQPLQKVLSYCKDEKNHIRFVFIKSIDRLTRAGATVYGQLKIEFAKLGINWIDTYGVVNASEVNTLEHLGVEYKWSNYSPTFITELLEAERSKSEVRDIETRMIGAAIRYVRMGYGRGTTSIGFIGEKTDTPDGKRIIWKPHPKESLWFIRMYELASQRTKSDQEIADEVNALGFETRKYYKRDKSDRTKIIEVKGGNKLTVKSFRNYLRNPIYAGVNTEKWLNGKPVYLKGGGVVSVELFNKANAGKIVIIDENGEPKVYRGKIPAWRKTKLKLNPLYPFKQYVLCPLCKRPFLGSASRGKSGNYFGAYHCGKTRGRNHKYLRIPLDDFGDVIEDFIERIDFSDKFIRNFERKFMQNWNARLEELNKHSINWEEKLIELRKKKTIFEEKLKMATTQTGFQVIEEELEDIKTQIAETTVKRNGVEDEEVDIEVLVKSAKYWMEHFSELVLETPNSLTRAALFGQIFEELPTFEELKNGTPKLRPLYVLNEEYKEGKNSLGRG